MSLFTHRRTLLGNTLMFALPVINYSPNKENRQTSTLDISIKDPKGKLNCILIEIRFLIFRL